MAKGRKDLNLNRREFLKAGVGVATAATMVGQTSTVAAKNMTHSKPNLIIILADQLRYKSCGFAGDPIAKTPNIDNFSTQGVNFANMVANSPVCTPFRASLLTGKYATSTGMVINEVRINPNQKCLGHIVSDAGYQTCYIGKWHLYANKLGDHMNPANSYVPPGPDRLGFDGYWAAFNFHHDNYGMYYHENSPEKIFYGENVYEPDAQTDMMIHWIQNQDKSKPFTAVLSYGTPHDPWTDDNAPKEMEGVFQESDFSDPPNVRMANDPFSDLWARTGETFWKNLNTYKKNYYAMTTNLDHNFGRLLIALRESGLEDNTIVVFSSDHGEMFGAQGRRAKNIYYEEAARVPLLIRWPKSIQPKNTSNACISTVDIMPTLLGLMDLPVPDDVEGMDCSDIAKTGVGTGPDFAFLQGAGATANWSTGHEWRAVRNSKYTYAVHRENDKKGLERTEKLFDNQDDPYQLKNLAGEKEHKRVLKKLRKKMNKKMKSLNDKFPESTWYRDNWLEDRKIVRTATTDYTH